MKNGMKLKKGPHIKNVKCKESGNVIVDLTDLFLKEIQSKFGDKYGWMKNAADYLKIISPSEISRIKMGYYEISIWKLISLLAKVGCGVEIKVIKISNKPIKNSEAPVHYLVNG